MKGIWYPRKANKMDVLKLIAKREIVTRDDLMHAFDYSYDGAVCMLWRLGRLKLIGSEISLDGKSKNWWLTPLGWRRLLYYAEMAEKEEREEL